MLLQSPGNSLLYTSLVTETEMEAKLENLLEQFKKFEEQRVKDQEEIEKLKGKLDAKSEDETKKEQIQKEIAEITRCEKEWQVKIEEARKKRTELEEQLKTEFKVEDDGQTQRFQTRAPEEKINLSFGGEQNSSAQQLRQFIEHYKLVKMVNMRNTLANWDDPGYRAAKLRIALLGAPADYVGEESSMFRAQTNDDEQILKN